MAAPMESEFLIQQQNALKFNGKQRSNCVFESTKTFSKDDQMFTVTIHDPQTCREFMVTHRKFSFRRWLQQTAVVNVFAFGFGFHKMGSYFLSALVLVLLVLLMLKLHLKVMQESLLVMASLGVQVTTTYALGRTSSQFYEIKSVKDIVINEGIAMHRVLFYLVLLLHNHDHPGDVTSLVPLFKHSWPGLQFLKEVYQGSQEVLCHKKNFKSTYKSTNSTSKKEL